MPYPVPHYLTVFGGPLSTNEQWTFSLRSSQPSVEQSPQSEETTLEAIEGVARAAWATSSPMGGDAKLGFIKHNLIGLDGKYVRGTTNVIDLSPVVASSTGSVYPLQVALVATLRTGVQRGLASSGRIYLPSPHYGVVGPNRTIAAAAADQAAAWVAALVSSLNNIPDYGNVVVCSDTREGAIRSVTHVEVGTVLDTMRSRRAQLVETRSSSIASGQDGGPF